jgi:hypothetical protein
MTWTEVLYRCVGYRPHLYRSGWFWYCGIPEGGYAQVTGFGDTPRLAFHDWMDRNYIPRQDDEPRFKN